MHSNQACLYLQTIILFLHTSESDIDQSRILVSNLCDRTQLSSCFLLLHQSCRKKYPVYMARVVTVPSTFPNRIRPANCVVSFPPSHDMIQVGVTAISMYDIVRNDRTRYDMS